MADSRAAREAAAKFANGNAPPGGSRVSGVLVVGALIVIGAAVLIYYSSRGGRGGTGGGGSDGGQLAAEKAAAFGQLVSDRIRAQYGGAHPNRIAARTIDEVGGRLVEGSREKLGGRTFEFEMLLNGDALDAYGSPNGDVFMTGGMLKNITNWRDAAALLAHEMGHILAGHVQEAMNAAPVATGGRGADLIANYDPLNAAHVTAMTNLLNTFMKTPFTPAQEAEADRFALEALTGGRYSPQALHRVLALLLEMRKTQMIAYPGRHPIDEERLKRIEAAIAEKYPDGVPEELDF